MTMMTKPAMVHGKRRPTTSDTGTSRMIHPKRRRSNMMIEPKNSVSVQTWIDSRIEYAYCDSWSATLHGVSPSHPKKARSDISSPLANVFAQDKRERGYFCAPDFSS